MPPVPATHLLSFVESATTCRFLVAFSGGLDSHVLLHLCAGLRQHPLRWQFRALHIDHGLQSLSAQWAAHCRQICADLGIPFFCETLNLKIPAGESVEAVARDARYRAFAQHLHPGEMLLTAHHQDDQAETLLLHLLRGSGVDGLAAMPALRPFAAGWMGRPLLGCSRSELETYAREQGLPYLIDPSNADTRFDRNFLRRQVMPLLRQRWANAPKTLARVAQLQAEQRQLLVMCTQEKLAHVQGGRPHTLSVTQLLTQPVAMRKALLREWLRQQGLPLPEAKKMHHVLQDVLGAAIDAMPCVHWAGCEVRRYRDDVYALPPLTPHDNSQVLEWDVSRSLDIPGLGICLSPEMLGGWLTYVQSAGCHVTVRFRQGGEQVLIPYRGGKHSLKHLMQEKGIPPWERDRLPLIYIGERLVSIIGVLHIEATSPAV